MMTCRDSPNVVAQRAAELRAKAEAAGQGHVFRFWDNLDEEGRAQLVESVSKIDFDRVNTYYKRVMARENSSEQIHFDEHLTPLNRKMTSRSFSNMAEALEERKNWYNAGLEAIANGTVAVVLLAGGQGTRLGSADPKGMYDVGLPSHKSLFQLQGERIKKVQELAAKKYGKNGKVVYYVMTSQPTHDKTVAFFESHKFFGLEPENVIFFRQFTLPCLSMQGQVLMESKSQVAESPDGNGGIYRAMLMEGVLDDMERRGVKHVHAYSVDNILVKVADPYFIGFCAMRDSETGLKVVPKISADEKVGVLCKYDGKFVIVEYSEISETVRNMREVDTEEAEGRLLYDAGNICNHYFSYDFLRRVCHEYAETLTHHIAKKSIPCVDENGNPTKRDGMKLELFIFDILQFSHNVQAYYAERAEEFSPLKNAPGAADGTPEHCRNDLLALHCRFIHLSGGEFADENARVEISPLVSYDGEGLRELVGGKVFEGVSQLC